MTGLPAVQHPGAWPEMRRPASLGLMVAVAERHTFGTTPYFRDILAISQAAAAAGIEALWFADHFSFTEGDDLRGSWDAWTLMAAVAAAVPGVKLGPMVACTAYRNPGVIAKMTEMIQDISGGRFILGLGAGWHKPEYDQFGLPFEPRVTRFEEALQIIHGLLREGAADVPGTYSQASSAVNLPRAESGPRTPIMIGSSGDRMLGLLATWADAWNTCWYGSTEGVADKVAKLDAACSAVGRDPRSVIRTAGVNIAWDGYTGSRPNPFRGSVDETVAFLREFEALGFQHLCVGLDPCTPESVEAFAPVVQAFNRGA
jgi:alkanesulfonate monooxygenase SsuD/methylene tetrahydromethanopterin reductase-like flavin-dependent oxidoreductase (luciferase family)